ncbi:hypothetical protein DPEC_G00254310 [Dallia pectoralis]|uniref:Uncharacterized protein n=1 Tax=Dallia pectoralis TaxID=75939 RepID=A0ACC2FUB8_DALPE|nr:hypothetical protein DPEC_G00254310 [Dallia pectoralis]
MPPRVPVSSLFCLCGGLVPRVVKAAKRLREGSVEPSIELVCWLLNPVRPPLPPRPAQPSPGNRLDSSS